MNARKPPSPPNPKLTRAPAKTQPEPRNPITADIMQRVRRVIVSSQGQITTASIADELGVNRRQFAEWISCYRAQPYGDNLIAIIRWLIPHDVSFVADIFYALKPKFIGEVDITRKLSPVIIDRIRKSTSHIAVLATKYGVHETMISKIRNGSRY